MFGSRITRRRLIPLALLLALGLLLAACGEDGSSDSPQSRETASPTATLTAPPADTPTPEPSEPADMPPVGDLLDEAGSRARADLADRLGVSLSEILVLDSDTAQLLDEPLLCPDVEPEDTAFAFVYVQHQQVIYPYQFYASAAANGVVVEACEDTLVDEDVLTMPTPNVRSELVALIEADLRQRGVDAEAGRFAVQPMMWHDEALGCPVTVDAPTPAPELVEGFLVTYTLDDRTYEYHTDGTGERITYCEPPMGHAANAAFIYSLRLDDMREVEVPEETVTYDGLDATGEVVLLTENQFRIGLFDFDTPEAARQAARLIDDERVAHIYVSGYVLIVQEENSPRVSSILLQYAERVRSPILERQQAANAAEAEAAETDEEPAEGSE